MIKSNFSGERLRSARMYRGITLTELAKRCNLNKQCISFYENNLNTPDYSKVQIIAKELNFPYDYFFQENGIIAKEEITYFRSLATATKRARISQSIKLQYVAKIYEILMNFISFPKLNLPQFDFNGNEKEIKKIAEIVRKHWQLDNQPIDNLQYILEKNGIIITGFSTKENKIDAFSQQTTIKGKDNYFIAIALGEKPQGRIYFDMAHELGHILLHSWKDNLNNLSREEFKKREKQANIFASEFLLPEKTFKEDASLYPTTLSYYEFLKNKWKVSIQAMIYKAHIMELMSDNQYEYMMRQISKKGWKKCEPNDYPYLLNENIFQSAIDILIENNIFSSENILDLLKNNGINLYAEDIEEILNLKPNTLKVKEKISPVINIKNHLKIDL